MSGIFFKTGEFAKLCGVKKDTLLHYDHFDLLKPEKTEENGYRYYSLKQLYTFDLISALKQLGMSLHEIKDYMDRRNPDTFLSLLREQLEVLAQERKRLESVELLLKENIKTTVMAQDVTLGAVRLEALPEEYYVAVKAPDFKHYDEQAFLLHTRSFIHWAGDKGVLDFRPGDIVTKESLEAGGFAEDYYFYYVDPETFSGPGKIQVKPAGTYAVLYHMGSNESLEKAYEGLTNWIRAHGYEMQGNLFEEDLIHYMASADPNQYVMKICIQVKETQ